jgi:LPXTG-motif cell wall-anchored protein
MTVVTPVGALVDTVRSALEGGSYPALVLLVAAENVFPPIPSEVILPLTGFYVWDGTLAFVPALLGATAGSVGGALVLYAVGRFGGRPLVLRLGGVLRVDEGRLDRADAWFDRHDWKVVLFGRMVPGMRSIVSIPAGLAEMPVGRFVFLTALGSGAWNALLVGAGWALGDNWEAVTAIVGQASTFVLAAVGALLLVALGVWLLRRRRRKWAG